MNETKRKDNELLRYEEVFENVMALYSALADPEKPYPLRRAEMKQGEVTAEPIDFTADVEIKAKRTLTPFQFVLLMQAVKENNLELIGKPLRWDLGKAFLQSKLNFDGDYRVLYYRAKNNQLVDRVEHEPKHFPEDAIDPEEENHGTE